jgi:predicted AAA+ superfamily ATPase
MSGYLESSYIVLVVERFSFKLKEQIMAPRKVYCIDTGMINTIAFRSSQDMGRLMENLVAVELHRRKSYYGGDDVFYWKDHQQREVDFVLMRGRMVNELIQVSYISSEEGIKDREFKGLLRAAGELGCGNMKVITWDYEGDVGDVLCVQLWKWLLADFRCDVD